MGLWNRLQAFIIFLQLVKDPNRTDLIFKGIELASKNSNQAPVIALENHVLANSEFARMYEQNYIPARPQMEYLAALPENTFGSYLYKHMKNNGLDFETFPRLPSDRAINYLSTRIYQDHDLWHVLLGYGIEVEDELALQAFGVAQYQSPFGTMLIAGGILHLLTKNPARAVDAFQKINEAYVIGKNAKFLLSMKIHELFPKPITEVRQMCGLI
jgi:ubiquinone biosynthesis protein Coq4